MPVPPLKLVALEVTRQCTLSCRHCRGNSQRREYENELTFDEIRGLLDSIRSFADPIIILTGGEPLCRADIMEIAAYSSSLGMRTVMATCGHMLDGTTAAALIDNGIQRISVSLDGACAATHDEFRGIDGAFDRTLAGLDNARAAGLPFQVNSTLTGFNIGELEDIFTLAGDIGAVGFHPFLLVPMGRGAEIREHGLSPEEYESALERIARMAATSSMEVKPTCSPHYARVERTLHLEQDHIPKGHTTRPPGHPRHVMTKGCMGGQGFVFVSHTGIVQACGFLELEAGSIRKAGQDIRTIWESSPLFTRIRDAAAYTGKCGRCEFLAVCGGCRARAYYINGDYMAEEPNCIYQPGGNHR